MRVKHFLNALEHARVHAAIKAAEDSTSGDIVVYITHKRVENALAAARDEFHKMSLERSSEQNSFLIFLAPKSQTFAVVGGTSLHATVGQAWWDDLSALLTRHFKEKRYTDGLVAAIERAGVALKKHFPSGPTDRSGQKDIVEE